MCVPDEKINDTLKIFNSINPNLQFTKEIENPQNGINYLDITVYRKNNGIISDWYHKNTYSGCILHYQSNHPVKQKIAMVYNLVDNATLLANKKFHEKNLNITKEILQANRYPENFIKKYTKNG